MATTNALAYLKKFKKKKEFNDFKTRSLLTDRELGVLLSLRDQVTTPLKLFSSSLTVGRNKLGCLLLERF